MRRASGSCVVKASVSASGRWLPGVSHTAASRSPGGVRFVHSHCAVSSTGNSTRGERPGGCCLVRLTLDSGDTEFYPQVCLYPQVIFISAATCIFKSGEEKSVTWAHLFIGQFTPFKGIGGLVPFSAGGPGHKTHTRKRTFTSTKAGGLSSSLAFLLGWDTATDLDDDLGDRQHNGLLLGQNVPGPR